MRIYTRKGDTGTTGLLFGGDRVSKADLRTDAYGTTDEAVSALGLARAVIGADSDAMPDWCHAETGGARALRAKTQHIATCKPRATVIVQSAWLSRAVG